MADKDIVITQKTYIFAAAGAVVLGVMGFYALASGPIGIFAGGVVGALVGGAMGLFL